jgi:hypothetical protein
LGECIGDLLKIDGIIYECVSDPYLISNTNTTKAFAKFVKHLQIHTHIQ